MKPTVTTNENGTFTFNNLSGEQKSKVKNLNIVEIIDEGLYSVTVKIRVLTVPLFEIDSFESLIALERYATSDLKRVLLSTGIFWCDSFALELLQHASISVVAIENETGILIDKDNNNTEEFPKGRNKRKQQRNLPNV